ncbi:AbrB/MazE/SpoVT family DNA-binding domain-containing protein [Candidatus Woesearchaeota archaeon]|nr:AbrB/MazE/SpoVT family DNA-binding domain-containing protein [Candidatus Woesearchaeota archaeon]
MKEKLISKEFLTTSMETSIVKITAKGQIIIPLKMQRICKLKKGDQLLVVEENGAIVLKKIKNTEFATLLLQSEKVAKELWDNKEDEIWDTV